MKHEIIALQFKYLEKVLSTRQNVIQDGWWLITFSYEHQARTALIQITRQITFLLTLIVVDKSYRKNLTWKLHPSASTEPNHHFEGLLYQLFHKSVDPTEKANIFIFWIYWARIQCLPDHLPNVITYARWHI